MSFATYQQIFSPYQEGTTKKKCSNFLIRAKYIYINIQQLEIVNCLLNRPLCGPNLHSECVNLHDFLSSSTMPVRQKAVVIKDRWKQIVHSQFTNQFQWFQVFPVDLICEVYLMQPCQEQSTRYYQYSAVTQ